MMNRKIFIARASLISGLVLFLCGTAIADQCVGEYAVDDSTVALYHLNEASGTTVEDASGSGWGGTLIGTNPPQWIAGKFSDGLHLESVYDSLTSGQIELPAGMLNMNSFTLEMYLKWDYLSQGPNPNETGFLGYIFDDGNNAFLRAHIDDSTSPFKCRLEAGVSTYDGYKSVITPTAFSIKADVWTHVAIVKEFLGWPSQGGQGVKYSIYINGVEAVSQTFATGGIQEGTELYFGNPSGGWGGSVDEIRISNVVRKSFQNDWGHRKGDINQDCYVDLDDLALLVADWMK